MSQFPEDDRFLINFLKQHRPSIPTAAPDLEERIIAALEPSSKVSRSRRAGQVVQLRYWGVASALAASLVAGLVSYRMFSPVQPSPIEVATLEAFIETTWYGAIDGHGEEENLLFEEPL